MMPAFDPFPLRGRCIGVSLSEGDAGIPLGEKAESFVNQLMFETGSRYLFLGACIALGHRWHRGGVMDHLIRRASEFRYSFPSPGNGERKTPIINRIAWPDPLPVLNESELDWMRDYFEVQQVQPANMDVTGVAPESGLGRFARTRALTAMRRELVRLCDFRICIGGRDAKPLRRLPGVMEEALLTYQAGKPLYLASAMGGTSRILCDAILHRDSADRSAAAFYSSSAALALFQEFETAYPFPPEEGPSTPGGAYDAYAYAKSIRVEELASRGGLTVEEYLTLMTTPDIGRALQLASIGVANTAAPPAGPPTPPQ